MTWKIHKVTIIVIAIVLIGFTHPSNTAAAVRPVSAIVAANLNAVEINQLPINPIIGTIVYSSWSYTYFNRYGTREYYAARARADLWSTWQTRYTWPYGRIARSTRYALVYNGLVWDIGATWIKNNGLFNLWGVQCNVTYRYNGYNVYTDGSNHCNAWGTGFGVDVTPVTWNEGGAYWGGLQFGANYRVSVLIQGTPLFSDHWMRETIFNNGRTSGAMGG